MNGAAVNIPTPSAPEPVSSSRFEDFTVVTVSPLSVIRDGEAAALAFEPDALIDTASLSSGDRVRGEWAQERLILHGRAGGVSLAPLESAVSDLQAWAALPTPGQVPSSVTVSSGAATVDSDGTVRITTATSSGGSLSINGVFDKTTGARAYMAFVRMPGGGLPTGSTIQMRLRASGVDDAASHYARQYLTATGTSIAAAGKSGEASFSVMYPASDAAPQQVAQINFGNPYNSGRPGWMLWGGSYGGSSAGVFMQYGQIAATGGLFDGLTFLGSSTALAAGFAVKVVRVL